mmetsp:Transcript_22237/g.69201  ORF Transcript_22237/g.69201 Transcript_22237/m.69201 type:complete len:258 (+) Transcript_22237:687-1460(+)
MPPTSRCATCARGDLSPPHWMPPSACCAPPGPSPAPRPAGASTAARGPTTPRKASRCVSIAPRAPPQTRVPKPSSSASATASTTGRTGWSARCARSREVQRTRDGLIATTSPCAGLSPPSAPSWMPPSSLSSCGLAPPSTPALARTHRLMWTKSPTGTCAREGTRDTPAPSAPRGTTASTASAAGARRARPFPAMSPSSPSSSSCPPSSSSCRTSMRSSPLSTRQCSTRRASPSCRATASTGPSPSGTSSWSPRYST